MPQKNRPFVGVSICAILGIIGGNIWIDHLYVSFFVFIIMLYIGSLILARRYGRNSIIILGSISLIFMMRVQTYPVELEKSNFIENQPISLIGTINEIKQGEYATQLILDNVQVKDSQKIMPLRSKVIVLVTKDNGEYNLYDQVICIGKVMAEPLQMNPSDMNYSSYLKGRGIVGRVKVEHINQIKSQKRLDVSLRKWLKDRIELVFKQEDKGIVVATLLGEDKWLEEEINELYFSLGIGHLLAISGFHIGIILLICTTACKKLGIPYVWRQLVGLLGIWGYVVLTGAAISTVRAAIILSIMLIGRCLWEEEDLPTNIAIAAVVLLGINPFQLSQVGFQLSFGAIIGISIYQYVVEYRAEYSQWTRKRRKVMEIILAPLIIFLVITPILSYHFFEVPLVGNLFNLVVMPLFSLLIPCMMICIEISLVNLTLAQWLAGWIISSLRSVETIGEVLMQCPLATWCIGRPSWESIVIYYMILAGVIWGVTHKISINQMGIGLIGVALICIKNSWLMGEYLEVTQLYVGQGDSTVVITPHKKAMLIDGGPAGKGKTIERYLKYKGITTLQGIILSHPHADHIRGIIELIGSDIDIGYIFIPTGFEREGELEELYKKCKAFRIPLYEIGKQGKILLETIKFEAVWPEGENEGEDANENSLVMLMTAGDFRALFTGDIGKTTEQEIIDELGDIDLLKVAHHGSKNSTQDTFLLQTKPEYAIISCGVNNLYGHPHSQTLEILEQYPIQVLRTDVYGAISLYTNGLKDIKLSYQVQEDK